MSDKTYSRKSLARLTASRCAANLAQYAADIIPAHDEWERPGELVEEAARLVEQARDTLAAVVVYERCKGVSWEAIGDALGGITKQAAAERFSPAERAFRRWALMSWLHRERAGDVFGLDSIDGLTEMTTTEAAGMVAEAARMLIERDSVTPEEYGRLSLALARRKVQVFEAIHAESPTDSTADALAGARARLAELEAGQ